MGTQSKQKRDRAISGKPYKIVEVHVTEKAAEYGLTELDVYKLVFGLETEYRAYVEPPIENFFTWKWRSNSELTIAGIFEPGDWKATVCICLFDELEKGYDDGIDPELLYPRHAPIAVTLPLTKLIETREETLFIRKTMN